MTINYGDFKPKTKKRCGNNPLKKGHTFREIQSIAHVGPDFIVKVKKETFGDDYVFESPRTRDSKNTQAIRLIRAGKELTEVALDLNMDGSEVTKAFSDYLELKKLDRLAELLSVENNEKLDFILMIAEVFKKKGMEKKEEISNALVKINDIEAIQTQIKFFK